MENIPDNRITRIVLVQLRKSVPFFYKGLLDRLKDRVDGLNAHIFLLLSHKKKYRQRLAVFKILKFLNMTQFEKSIFSLV